MKRLNIVLALTLVALATVDGGKLATVEVTGAILLPTSARFPAQNAPASADDRGADGMRGNRDSRL